MTSGSSVFLVPVLDRFLVWAPLHGVAAVVNARAAAVLRDGGAGAAGDLAALIDELARPIEAPGPPEGEASPSFLGILPTRGCNLACAYCNFGGPDATRVHMRPEIAVAAVDWMADGLARAGRRRFDVHFFGGEPFLSPDIVDVVTHRVRWHGERLGIEPHLGASTNGVFSGDRAEFIGDYFSSVTLSLDGPAEFHDRHRPALAGRPSFDVVSRTARALSQTPVELCLRACITNDSVGEMEAIVRWMAAAFAPSAVNFESLTPGPLAARAGLAVPDPYRFADGAMRAYRAGEALGVKVVYSAAEIEQARLSFCPVGTDAVIVSPDGRASACYLRPDDWRAHGLDMDIGWVRNDGEVTIDSEALDRVRRLVERKPRCEGCFCRWTCAGGCHVNQTFPGAEAAYTDFCIQTRLVTACRLLDDMGLSELADELLSSRPAMEALADRAWDRVGSSAFDTRITVPA